MCKDKIISWFHKENFALLGCFNSLKGYLQKVEIMANEEIKDHREREIKYILAYLLILFLFFCFLRPLPVMPQEQFQRLVKDKQ